MIKQATDAIEKIQQIIIETTISDTHEENIISQSF
jgi:hypothetical protein